MTFLKEVRAKRQKLADVLSDEDYSGIRGIVEELYPDRAHFIYELLQNAEDTGATEATFKLFPDSLVFEHNGHPFTEENVWGITNIGKGTKSGQDDKIGRFGVGFKAVFAYSETPHIWSPTFSFKITDLVLPSALDPKPDLGRRTCFEFPFNNPKKDSSDAYAEIKAGLNELAETTLLFLSHLESISWQIGQTDFGEVLRIQHSENHFEVLKQSGAKTTASSHFLKFDQPVKGLEKQRVAIALALDFLPNIQRFDPQKPLAKQLKIIPAEPGRVAVFFPAEKEASGLRFHLHAPFVPELSRASIKETPANQPLFQQLATLTASSLHQIRDLGLLTAEFLSVLPNSQDPLHRRYQDIRSAIVEEMNNQPLTPTYAKSHAPAKNLLQAKASLKELLSKSDIEFLVDCSNGSLQWAVGAAQKNSNADRFLAGLAITEWDIENFVELLEEKTSDYSWKAPDNEFIEWLSKKPVEWHQKFYALLFDYLSNAGWLREKLVIKLRYLRIVRLSTGDYSTGNKCFFSSDGCEHDEVLPRVDIGVYKSGKGKTQQENSRRLLEEIGVRDVGEAEQVEAILKQRYAKDSKISIDKTYKRDLKRFISFIEKSLDKADLFTKYFIFKCDDDHWRTPNSILLDQPFVDTGLGVYYETIGESEQYGLLAESYQDCGITIKRLIEFAKAVGCQTKLSIEEQSTYDHPFKNQLRIDYHKPNVKWTGSAIDKDWILPGLEIALKKPSVRISRLIWKTLKESDTTILTARFRPNQQYTTQSAPSSLVLLLRRSPWIPQGNDLFVPPAEASYSLLPPGFPVEMSWPWLKAIGFGEELDKRSEEQRQKQAIAKELGFSDREALEDGQWFANLSSEQRQNYKNEHERRQRAELPEHESANPERRSDRVIKQAANAPERRTEERTRSVSVGQGDVKQEAAQYLLQQYTNTDGEMICQVCKAPLPFKLADGSDYFEKVEFLPKLKKRHYQNYLALCPNHAAMFQYANGSADLMQEMFVELIDNELEVVLAQKDTTIYFTKTHIADLKNVIYADNASSMGDISAA